MVFSHIGAVAFMVLGLAMVKLMTNLVGLLAKNYNNDPDDDVHEEGVKRALEESIKLKKLKVIKITRHQFITKKL